MIRLNGQYVPVKAFVLAFSESCLILLSIWCAAWMRFGALGQSTAYLADPAVFSRVVLAIGICVICFYCGSLYDLNIVSRRTELVIRLMQTMGAASLILAGLYSFFPALMLSRGVSAIACVIAPLALVMGRMAVDASGYFFRPEQRVLVAGTGDTSVLLVEEIKAHPELNFIIIGFLSENALPPREGLPLVGQVGDIEKIVDQYRVDRVVIGLAERRGCMPVDKLLRVRLSGIAVEDARALYEKLAGRILLDHLNPSMLILGEGFKKTLFQRFFKRLEDVVISSLGLLLTAPLLLLVAVAIYLESGGPIFFRQKRTGLHAKPFEMLKFRSMTNGGSCAKAQWAKVGDPRITRVGRIIRKFRIDEIPQFVNVLRGDMSVVGPRPEQPDLVALLEEKIPYYIERHSVRPGITGWAQIRSGYSSSIEDSKLKLEYDFFYIKHLSIVFDAMVMFRTFQVVLTGNGAV